MKSALKLMLVTAIVLVLQPAVFGSSIVTMPTADVAPVGSVVLSTYHVNFDYPAGMPDSMNVYIAYAGIASNLEIEATRYDPDTGATSNFLVATYKVLDETATRPQLSIGVKNLNETVLSGNDDPTYFIATVKTINPPAPGMPFKPVIRIHANYGNNLHNGFFGGVQALVTPRLGLAAVNDGEDTILAATYTAKPNGLTLKVGTLGDHSWVGADYSLRF